MSDATQGPGWWQASDGLWYPPDQHPDFAAPTEAVESVPPADATQAMAPVPPPVPPGPPVVVARPVGPVGPPPPGGGRGKVIAIVAVLAAIAVVAALLLVNRDSDDGAKVAASDTDSTDVTDQSDSTDATTTTKKTTTTTAKTTTTRATTTTAPAVDAAALTARLLTPEEMGEGMSEGTFTPDSKNPEACGSPNTDTVFPPEAIVGRASVQAQQRAVVEQVRAYADAATSAKAFQRGVDASSCSEGNAFDAQGKPVPITIGPIQEISDVKGAVRAIAVSLTGEQFEALVVAVDVGGEIVAFQFETVRGAGTETLEARLPVVEAGVAKLAG
ncbi:MAG: hypothetical protein QOE35_3752 [Actinomycetota bacterium]